MHYSIVISDASCIIALDNIGYLHLLQNLFVQIHTTKEVLSEVGITLPHWVKIEEPSNIEFQQNLELTLDKGEASAIALALESENCLLLIDEIKGRETALKLGLQITGTIGILLSAKEHKLVEKIEPLLSSLIQHGFYIGKNLQLEILSKAGEL